MKTFIQSSRYIYIYVCIFFYFSVVYTDLSVKIKPLSSIVGTVCCGLICYNCKQFFQSITLCIITASQNKINPRKERFLPVDKTYKANNNIVNINKKEKKKKIIGKKKNN